MGWSGFAGHATCKFCVTLALNLFRAFVAHLMGLSLTKTLVEHYWDQISVARNPGKETCSLVTSGVATLDAGKSRADGMMLPKAIACNPLDEAFLQKVMHVIMVNLSNDEIRVEQLNVEVNMSRSNLFHKGLHRPICNGQTSSCNMEKNH